MYNYSFIIHKTSTVNLHDVGTACVATHMLLFGIHVTRSHILLFIVFHWYTAYTAYTGQNTRGRCWTICLSSLGSEYIYLVIKIAHWHTFALLYVDVLVIHLRVVLVSARSFRIMWIIWSDKIALTWHEKLYYCRDHALFAAMKCTKDFLKINNTVAQCSLMSCSRMHMSFDSYHGRKLFQLFTNST